MTFDQSRTCKNDRFAYVSFCTALFPNFSLISLSIVEQDIREDQMSQDTHLFLSLSSLTFDQSIQQSIILASKYLKTYFPAVMPHPKTPCVAAAAAAAAVLEVPAQLSSRTRERSTLPGVPPSLPPQVSAHLQPDSGSCSPAATTPVTP